MPRPKSNLAPRILDAARERFLVEGVDGASLRQIASDAGTNIGMIYYYYPTKEDLFAAILDEVYEGFLGDVERALEPDVPPEARLERLYARIATMDDNEFKTIRIVVREAMISSSRLDRIAERVMRGHFPKLLSTLAEGRGSECFDPNIPLPVELGAVMVLGIFPQIVRRLVAASNLPAKDLLPPADEAATHLSHVLLHGIAGPKLRRKRDEP